MLAVVTTIQGPTRSMRALAQRATIFVVGDEPGPERYDLPSTRLITLEEQRSLPFKLASLLPTRSYARKNLGYLLAFDQHEPLIYETDDDNAPLQHWEQRDLITHAQPALGGEWINVYRAFTHRHIWPRGFPLELTMDGTVPALQPHADRITAPIQQGLANGSPDVDAVWRMTQEQASFTFSQRPSVLVPAGSWCPFNSQSTWWFPDAYPLMYLPSYCSFRVTDIWRSFVAQRCLWEQGLGVVFHAPEVFQDRNVHDPHEDFVSEYPAYLNNARIARALAERPLIGNLSEDMWRCYELMVRRGWFDDRELHLLEAWLEDVSTR